MQSVKYTLDKETIFKLRANLPSLSVGTCKQTGWDASNGKNRLATVKNTTTAY
jgi:hypothetical protein